MRNQWGVVMGKAWGREAGVAARGEELRRALLLVLVGVGAALIGIGCAGDSGGTAGAGKELTPEQKKQAESFGLDPEKPYAGTELNFLICCNTAPQFASLADLSNKEFTKLTGISVKWGNVPFESYQQKIVAEATTGDGTYDLVSWIDSWGPAIRGSLLPLDDKIQEDNIDMGDFPDAYREAIELGSEEGQVYGMPLRGHPLMFFYRQDVYDDLGLERPETLQEFVEQGDKINQAGEMDPTAMYYGRSGGQNMWLYLSHLWSNGGDIFDEEYRPIFNSPEGVEAMELYVDYLQEYDMTPKASVAWNEQEGNQAFNRGDAATFMGWWWMYGLMTSGESAPEVQENAQFAPMPSWEGKDAVSYAMIWPAGILQSSQNQDAAWEYLKWMTSKEVEKKVAMRDDKPEYANNVVVRESNLRDPEINEKWDGIQEVGADVLEDARTTPMIPEWLEVQDILSRSVNQIAGGADAQKTLDEAANEVEALMEREGYYE